MNKKKTSLLKPLTNGIIGENPTFRLVLGTCPTIAITTAVMNGIGMGAAATFVLVGSNLVISLLRNFIPDNVRIPAFVVVIAAFVTIVELVMKAYLPALDQSLGIFIPLIVVNCIILARAEAFASKNGPLPSIMDGLGMGIGFTIAISLIAVFREVLGNGTLLGISLFGENFQPMLVMVLAPGGFLTFGLVLGAYNLITNYRQKKKGGDA
ncbi:electron transport complex subunit E [Eubacteriales bacterium OttesenSCG-928-M02]|nr:electron transport complex subunit E [Eubacteriales bacterium OttesenSCG-928-M02]